MRRVRLSNSELRTRSAARIRSAKLLYCSSHPERCSQFSGSCRAGNDRRRFADIRRVRLSHSE
eukprot:464013-Pyramimonas_sp.AAC.1